MPSDKTTSREGRAEITRWRNGGERLQIRVVPSKTIPGRWTWQFLANGVAEAKGAAPTKADAKRAAREAAAGHGGDRPLVPLVVGGVYRTIALGGQAGEDVLIQGKASGFKEPGWWNMKFLDGGAELAGHASRVGPRVR